jgi:hypothetical protein
MAYLKLLKLWLNEHAASACGLDAGNEGVILFPSLDLLQKSKAGAFIR